MDDQYILSKSFEIIEEYYDKATKDELPLVGYLPPKELLDTFDFNINDEGVDQDQFLGMIKEYLKYSVNTGSKQFFNQLYAGRNMPAFLGDVITSLTNTSMYTYEVAPVATMMEHQLVAKMCGYAGFENGEGTFVTGGSNTNLVAMICARNTKFPEVKSKGMWGMAPITAFVSDQSHYSFSKGANAMGLGMRQIIKVQSDEKGQMMPEALDQAINDSIARGEQPFFVGATTGTTELGAFDPLEPLGEIARKHDLWFHVDGSWGGSIVLSQKHRHLFNGLEKADSFSWNPHKMMNIPLICSVFLVNHKGALYQHLSTKDTDYIFHDNDNAAYDLGPASLQCGKRVDSLKLWMAWKFYGNKGYEARIDHLFDMAQYATEKINAHPNLELLSGTQTVNVNFRYVPNEETDLNVFNEELRERMLRKGRSMVNYCHLDNDLSIRLTLANADIEAEDMDLFFENLLSTAEEMTQSETVSA